VEHDARNAYVSPLIDRIFARLEDGLRRRRLSIMQSNGGSISASLARSQAVRTRALRPRRRRRRRRAPWPRKPDSIRIISFEHGRTSTDVSLVDEAIPTSTESRIR